MFSLSHSDRPSKSARIPNEVQYLNDEITFPVIMSKADSRARVQKPLLQRFISRSGRIVDTANEYFVAVIRLAISLTVPIFMPEMILPSVDGVSTLLSVSMMRCDPITKAIIAAVDVPIKLQIVESQRRFPQTFQDATDGMYASFNHPDELCAAVNEALDTCVNGLFTAGAPSTPAINPEMMYDPVTHLYSFNVYHHGGFVQPVHIIEPGQTTTDGFPLPAGVPVALFSIWFNHCSYPIMKGFNTFHVSKDDYVPHPGGLDYKLDFVPNEDARIPVPLNFNNPTNIFGYKLKQDTPTVLPTLETIRVLTDLPSVGEIVPSTDDVETAGILTDFKLDNSFIGSSAVLYYNASLGDARYIKLTGTAPVQAITYRVEALDTYGKVHQIRLQGPGDFFSIKMAFVKNNIVEHY